MQFCSFVSNNLNIPPFLIEAIDTCRFMQITLNHWAMTQIKDDLQLVFVSIWSNMICLKMFVSRLCHVPYEASPIQHIGPTRDACTQL